MALNMTDSDSDSTTNGYNISALAKWFARVPRLGTNFEPLHNLTILEGSEYVHSMAMYGIIAAIIAALASIVLVLFCCCNAMFRSSPKYGRKKCRSKDPNVARFVLLAMAVLGAATFAIGFVGEHKVHQVANGTCDTIHFVDDQVNLIKNETDLILQQMNLTYIMSKVQVEINAATAAANEMGQMQPSASTSIHQYTEYFDNIRNQIQKAEDTIKKEVIENILDKVIHFLHPISESCLTASLWVHVLNLVVLIVLAISSLIFILALYGNCYKYVVCVIGYLMWLIIFCIGALVFVSLVGGSDFCTSSKKVVNKYISTPATEYYLYCAKRTKLWNCTNDSGSIPDNSGTLTRYNDKIAPLPTLPPLPTMPSFPQNGAIDELLDQTSCFVSQSKTVVKNFGDSVSLAMNSWCNLTKSINKSPSIDHLCSSVDRMERLLIGNQNERADSLLKHLEHVSKSVAKIIAIADCNAVTPKINGHLSSMCTTLYDAFFYYLVNSLAAVACFYLMMLLIIWLLFRDAAAEEDDDMLPSAPPSAYINPKLHTSVYMNEFLWRDALSGHRPSNKTTVL